MRLKGSERKKERKREREREREREMIKRKEWDIVVQEINDPLLVPPFFFSSFSLSLSLTHTHTLLSFLSSHRLWCSAKMLTAEDTNVAYICSRFYRAPELLFGMTRYSHTIGREGPC